MTLWKEKNVKDVTILHLKYIRKQNKTKNIKLNTVKNNLFSQINKCTVLNQQY